MASATTRQRHRWLSMPTAAPVVAAEDGPALSAGGPGPASCCAACPASCPALPPACPGALAGRLLLPLYQPRLPCCQPRLPIRLPGMLVCLIRLLSGHSRRGAPASAAPPSSRRSAAPPRRHSRSRLTRRSAAPTEQREPNQAIAPPHPTDSKRCKELDSLECCVKEEVLMRRRIRHSRVISSLSSSPLCRTLSCRIWQASHKEDVGGGAKEHL